MVRNDKEDINKNLNLLVKASFVVFIGVFFSKILTYLYKFVIARNFGPEIYGLFSLATIIISFFSTLASLGLSDGLLRYASLFNDQKSLKKVKPLLRFSLIFSIISSIIFSLLIYLLADIISNEIFHNSDLASYLVFFSISIPFILLLNIFLSIIKANQQIVKYTFVVNVLQNLIRVLVIFFMIFIGLESSAIISSYLLGVFVATIVSYFFARSYIFNIFKQKDLVSKESKLLKKSFLSYSWPIIFAGFVGTLLYWVDSLTIGYLMDATSVGIYGAAFTVVSLMGIAPELFMQLFLPLIIKEYSKNKIEVIDQISKQVSKWIGILNLPIFAIMFVFPETIISILFGDQYLGAASSLKILSVGGFFSSFISLNTSLLSMKGRSKTILVTLCLASGVNLILDFILIKIYGIDGAAMATSIVWILTLITLSMQVYFSTKILAVRRKLVRIIVLSVIPTLILLSLSKYGNNSLFNLVIAFLSYLIVYFIIIIFSRGLDETDTLFIKKIFNLIKKKKSNFSYTNQPSL